MNRLLCFMTLASLFLCSAVTHAQSDIGKTVTKNGEKNATDEAGKGTDKGIAEAPDANKTGAASSQPELKAWSRYDFVSGDKVLFEDNLAGEQNGEFPSRWELVSGNAENASFGTERVISYQAARTAIAPLMKTKSYLPEHFTIEFDVYFHLQGNEAYVIRFDKKTAINIRNHVVTMGKLKGEPEAPSKQAGWRRIALAFNKRALKVYYNQDRVLNVPNFTPKPASFSIEALSHDAKKGKPAMIKNIRVAEGGVKLYDRVMADGKFVTRGIYFESGKAIVKPESQGVLNEIAVMMKEHPELRFRVEGHTDSDGDDAFNRNLSKQRAEAVKQELAKMGIAGAQFETDGFGESKPVDANTTPEGKANNRRVEFIKL